MHGQTLGLTSNTKGGAADPDGQRNPFSLAVAPIGRGVRPCDEPLRSRPVFNVVRYEVG